MDAKPMSGNDLLPLVVFHQQGWGNMGVDTAVFGGGNEPAHLQIGDKSYDTGLGLHAPGEIWLSLEKGYSLFECEVGVQKQLYGEGSVVFKVYADDKLVFDSGVMRGTDPAKAVSVPVEGVQYLKLEYGDAGDGITCDCADWVNVRLTPSATAAQMPANQPLDIAPFGRVLTWNPYVKDGTHVLRSEEFPARDLFPGDPVSMDKGGAYLVPVVQSPFQEIGLSCIGLEWLEQRRIRRAELHTDGPAIAPKGVQVEYWALTPMFDGTPGVSRWQGHWEHLNSEVKGDGNVWSVEFGESTRGWLRPKTMKLRWLIPTGLGNVRVQKLLAYTDSNWRDADITLRALQPAAGATADLNIYNGSFEPTAEGGAPTTWDMSKPLHLRVRYAEEAPWTRGERTVLRLTLPQQGFGIAIGDVVKSDAVYVKEAGIVAIRTEREQDVDGIVAASEQKKTVLEEVRQMPDQTFEQAMEHVHRAEADFGPTLLSLAHGNEKFLLQRTGELGFDTTNNYNTQVYHIAPAWEGQDNPGIERHLDGGWMPIPVITHKQGGVSISQRTFVAPFGKCEATGKAAWYHNKPLCVAEYTFSNPGAAAPVSMTFVCTPKEAVALRTDARGVIVELKGRFRALLDTTGAKGLTASVDGTNISLAGTLAAGAEARCVLLIPGWEAAPEALPAASESAALLEATRKHWNDAMAGSARIATPDPLLNNVIAASRVHCMLAARNEDGVRVAPWVASTNYGPLESEGHSVVRGMEFMGHEDFARRGLDFFINRYNKQGYLTTGYTVIGTGWHLWALGEYSKLYRNDEWLRANAPEVSRVCEWILEQRGKTQQVLKDGQRPAEYGLMPPGVLADWGVYAHYFYLDGNYYAGLKSAGDALAEIGWGKAGAMQQAAAEFRGEIADAFKHVQAQAPVLALRDGTWVPAYPTQLYSPMPIADMYVGDDVGRSWCYDVELGAHHLVPMGVLDPHDRAVDDMMNHMEDVQFLESGWFYYPKEENHADWFNRGGYAKVQPYYARNVEVDALRDDVKPFVRSYFNSVVTLLNREDLSLWEHFMNGAFNKTHETGYFLHQSRLMFVQERGNSLWLAPFVPTQWLEDGQSVDVQDMPTFFGKTGFTTVSHLKDGYIDVVINAPQRKAPEEIVVRLRHPQGKALASAEVSGAKDYKVVAEDSTVHITPAAGTINVRARYAE
jgi:hypothetical protein